MNEFLFSKQRLLNVHVDTMKWSISFLENNAYVEYEYIKLDLILLEVVKVTIN